MNDVCVYIVNPAGGGRYPTILAIVQPKAVRRSVIEVRFEKRFSHPFYHISGVRLKPLRCEAVTLLNSHSTFDSAVCCDGGGPPTPTIVSYWETLMPPEERYTSERQCQLDKRVRFVSQPPGRRGSLFVRRNEVERPTTRSSARWRNNTTQTTLTSDGPHDL